MGGRDASENIGKCKILNIRPSIAIAVSKKARWEGACHSYAALTKHNACEVPA